MFPVTSFISWLSPCSFKEGLSQIYFDFILELLTHEDDNGCYLLPVFL